MQVTPLEYFLKDDGIFPNSNLPVLLYKKVLKLPALFPAAAIKSIFRKYNWANNWRNGIYTYHHYHSITDEAMGVVKGQTRILLGGNAGITIELGKGDVLIIPAGVAHKNLGKEKDVICVGGYPDGKSFDMNYGRPEERLRADRNIALLQIPATDPFFGREGLPQIWRKYKRTSPA